MDTESVKALVQVLTLAEEQVSKRQELIQFIAGLIAQGEDPTVAVIDTLRQVAVDLKASREAEAAAIDAAIARLSDNPSPTDVAAVVESLTSLNDSIKADTDKIAAIDPDQPGGVVADGSGGVTDG